jgi:hypothetical protein
VEPKAHFIGVADLSFLNSGFEGRYLDQGTGQFLLSLL